MDIADLIPAVIATLVSTSIIALSAVMMPGVRWSRQLARDIHIANGLPAGEERDAWEVRIVHHARRLRLFNDVMPLRHKVWPWVPVGMTVVMIFWVVLDPRQIDGVIAEGPIMIPFTAAFTLSLIVFLVTGVRGLTPDGQSAEDLLLKQRRRARAKRH